MSKATLGLLATLLFGAPSIGIAQQTGPTLAQGAQVYATTCGRCHQARPGSERTDREWGPIIAHMRARANLTKTQAAAVLLFLRATNAPESGTGSTDFATRVILPRSLMLGMSVATGISLTLTAQSSEGRLR